MTTTTRRQASKTPLGHACISKMQANRHVEMARRATYVMTPMTMAVILELLAGFSQVLPPAALVQSSRARMANMADRMDCGADVSVEAFGSREIKQPFTMGCSREVTLSVVRGSEVCQWRQQAAWRVSKNSLGWNQFSWPCSQQLPTWCNTVQYYWLGIRKWQVNERQERMRPAW